LPGARSATHGAANDTPKRDTIVVKGHHMLRARFRRLVDAAIDSIPDEFLDRMDNIELIVRMRPAPDELRDAGIHGGILLGLYQGHPLTVRDSYYGNTLPDRIFIYQESIERICRSEEEVVLQVRKTVLHEIAHHFGIDDDRLDEIGMS
jgi:predicted Zn-dependent protease with MMP-like domain